MKLLIFQHVPHEHPGLILDYARERGIQLTIIELWKQYKMPGFRDFDGLIIMGGPMGVYEGKDKYPSKEDEISFIKNAMEKIPIIGFCLGSQLLAYALGAEVKPNTINGKIVKEIGYYDIDLTEDGSADPIFRNFSSSVKVLQWHGDAFSLPSGATLLATSKDCQNQAFRYGHMTYATLFHFEFTPEMILKQIGIDKNWIHKDFNFDEGKIKEEAEAYKSLMKRQCEQLMDNFTSLIKV